MAPIFTEKNRLRRVSRLAFVRDLKQTIGETASRARVARNWTQEDVSDAIDISPGYYWRIEKGREIPSLKTLIKLSALFDVEADVMLGFKPLREQDITPDRKGRQWRKLERRLRRLRPAHIRLISRMLNWLEYHPMVNKQAH